MRRNRKHTPHQKTRVRRVVNKRTGKSSVPKFRFTSPGRLNGNESPHRPSLRTFPFLSGVTGRSGQHRRLQRFFTWPLLGLLLLLIGSLLLFSPFTKQQRSDPAGSTADPFVENGGKTGDFGPIKISTGLLSGKESSQPPMRIVIPALSIDLPVIEANVVDGTWELSETTASHGVGSANPGTLGNTVIFAHARDGLFGPLRKITKEHIIYVLTKDRWYRYQIKDAKEVSPKQIGDVAPTKDEILTLFTCSGFLDSKRLLITAKPM